MKFQAIYIAILVALYSLPAAADIATELPEIEVKGSLGAHNAARIDGGNTEKIDEHKLKMQAGVSLGQSLEHISGVQNNSFGPNNGLPQIRSLTGHRVQILENGLGVSDMAAISGNLPTAIQPLLAEQITVHKSDSAVLYGGNAIGGAVNIENGLIPKYLPERSITGKLELSGGYNTPHNEIFGLNGKLGNVAWHLDGGNSQISSYRIPGKSKPEECYRVVGENLYFPMSNICQFKPEYEYFFNKGFYRYVDKRYLDPSLGESWRQDWGLALADIYKTERPSWADAVSFLENPEYDPSITVGQGRTVKRIVHLSPDGNGRMNNSHMHNQHIGAGISYIGKQGYVGIGLNRSLYRYGVPGYAAYDTRTKSGTRTIDGTLPANIEAEQTRWMMQSQYRPNSVWIDSIDTKFAHTNTENKEYLGNYLSGSLNSRSNHLRVELNHHAADFLKGSIGAEWKTRSTDGQGADRYLPDTDTRSYSIFALERFKYKNLTVYLGGRIERVSHTPDFSNFKPDRNYGGSNENKSYRFTPKSYQAGITWQPFAPWQVGIRYSRSQRAPEINELFAGNNHFATFSREFGNTANQIETAKTLEFSSELKWRQTSIKAAIYHTTFQDYFYQSLDSHSVGYLPTRYWRQGDTRVQGVEWEISHFANLKQYGALEARIFADLVKNSPISKPSCDAAHLTSDCIRYWAQGDYMPNMPTSRYGIGLDWNKGKWRIGSSLTRYAAQKRRGKILNEEPDLGGYTLWDAYLSYTHKAGLNSELEWFIDGRNLSNTEARPHNSTLKYLTPLPGRSIRVGLRMSF